MTRYPGMNQREINEGLVLRMLLDMELPDESDAAAIQARLDWAENNRYLTRLEEPDKLVVTRRGRNWIYRAIGSRTLFLDYSTRATPMDG